MPHPGIGAPLTDPVPFEDGRVIGISRRSCPRAEHLKRASPTRAVRETWPESSTWLLPGGRPAPSVHLAGVGGPHGTAAEVDLGAYINAVLLNSAAPQILVKAFVQACRHHAVISNACALLLPAAASTLPGISSYGSAKAATDHWVRSVGAEDAR